MLAAGAAPAAVPQLYVRCPVPTAPAKRPVPPVINQVRSSNPVFPSLHPIPDRVMVMLLLLASGMLTVAEPYLVAHSPPAALVWLLFITVPLTTLNVIVEL